MLPLIVVGSGSWLLLIFRLRAEPERARREVVQGMPAKSRLATLPAAAHRVDRSALAIYSECVGPGVVPRTCVQRRACRDAAQAHFARQAPQNETVPGK